MLLETPAPPPAGAADSRCESQEPKARASGPPTYAPLDQPPDETGLLDRAAAKLIALGLRWTYRLTGRRLSDEALRRLGARWRGMHRLATPMRDGRVLYLDLRNPVSIPYLLEGEFPPEKIETQLVRSIVRGGDVAVDVGANVGWYAGLLCRLVGETGAVHAFEPNPAPARLLRALQRDHPQLVVHVAAVGDHDGQIDFYIPDNWISGSCRPASENAQRRRATMTTLTSASIPSADFIKLDAEGAEMDVLAGAGAILDSREAPIWMVELSTEDARRFGRDPADVVGVFQRASRADYACWRIDQDRPRLEPLELPRAGDYWMNALFAPRSRRSRIPSDWLGPR